MTRNDIRVLIADDEPLARRSLRAHLQTVGWIAEIHEAADGRSALRAIDESKPHLVFLDIVMPGLSGVSVAQKAVHRPYIVFTTAFDQYAITAFEIGALDYLLKPFGRDRVRQAVERAGVALEHRLPDVASRAATMLDPSEPLTSIYVKERGRMLRIPLESVERLEACDDYVAVHAQGKKHLIHVTLREMHARLDPSRFIRVHRSHVVNVSCIESLVAEENSRTTVMLRNGGRVPASRAGSLALKKKVRS
jgi:two-component system LytT family response regulator